MFRRTLRRIPQVLVIATIAFGVSIGNTAAERLDSAPAPNAPKLDGGIVNPLIEDAPTGRYGGTLKLCAYEDPKTFNPLLAIDGTSSRFIAYCFDGLVDEDGLTCEVKPALAETWTIAPDGKTYTFKLRNGVKWHDGRLFTADDVIFTWKLREQRAIAGQKLVVTKVDDATVRFELTWPYRPFLREMAFPVMPKHIFASDSSSPSSADSLWGTDADVTTIVGTGAWIFDGYTPGRHVELRRNPHYYRVNRHHQPLPYFDRMKVTFLQDVKRAIGAFEAGETDMQWLPGKDVASLKPKEKAGNFQILDAGPDFRTSYMLFNLNPGRNHAGKPYVAPHKLKWFASTKFRQALSYAIDREAIITEVYRRLAAPQNSPIFQKSPYYDPSVPQYPFNLDKSRQLLAEAGFVRKGDTLYDANGYPVLFEMLTSVGSDEVDKLARMITASWKKLGIKLKRLPVTFNEKIARTHGTMHWECAVVDWGAGLDPEGLWHFWQSNGEAHIFNLDPAETPHENPTYSWEKRIDELFSKGSATIDLAKRKQIYSEFQHVVMREQPMIFLPVFFYTIAVRNTIGNVAPSAYSALGASWNSYELFRRNE